MSVRQNNRGTPGRGAISGPPSSTCRNRSKKGQAVTHGPSQEAYGYSGSVFLQTDRVAAATARTSGAKCWRRSVLAKWKGLRQEEAGGGVNALSTSSSAESKPTPAVVADGVVPREAQASAAPSQDTTVPTVQSPPAALSQGTQCDSGMTQSRSFSVLKAASPPPLTVAPVYPGDGIVEAAGFGMTKLCRDLLRKEWERIRGLKASRDLLLWLTAMGGLGSSGGAVEYHYGAEMPPFLPGPALLVSEADVVYTKGHNVATGLERPFLHGAERRTGDLSALRSEALIEGDYVVSRRDTGGEDLRPMFTVWTDGHFWSQRIRLSFVAEIEAGGEIWQIAQVLKCTTRVLPSVFGTGPRELLSRKSVREALREIPHGDPAVRARIAWGLVQAYQPDRIVSAMMRAQVTEPDTLVRMDPVDFVDSVRTAERVAAETWGVPSMTVQW